MDNPSHRYTLVYDGSCRMCTRMAKAVRRWDRQDLIDIVPSQEEGVQARFPWIPAGAYRESMQLVGPEGNTWQGAAAAEEIIRILPRGRLIAWVFKIPGVRPIAERIYRWVARNRYRLGCGDHCQLRPPSSKHSA